MEKISKGDGYPQRIKDLVEQLRVEKEKMNKLKEVNKNLDKNSRAQQERMIQMEESIRELRQALQKKKQKEEDLLMPAASSMTEDSNSKPSPRKSISKSQSMLKLQKKLFDKTLVSYKKKINHLEEMVAAKDKEIKIQALKLKELITADKIKRNSIVIRDFELLQ